MEALKKATLAVAELLNTVGDVMEDGKFKWGEMILFVPNIKDIIAIVKNSPDAYKELKAGISPEQRAEIEKAVADKLDMPNDKAEELTELSIGWIVNTVHTVSRFVEVLKK